MDESGAAGDDEHEDDFTEPPASSSRAASAAPWGGSPWVAGALAVALLLLGSLGGYLLAGGAKGAPADWSADAGFARDMQTHHNQAVQMAWIIRDKTTDPALRTLAYDIATSQQQQAGQMYGWLVQWGLPQTGSTEPMTWMTASMDHEGSHPNSTDPSSADSMQMPGMATPEEIRALEQATGIDAERRFLTLMIRHHQGGVAMAEAALDLAERPEVLGLAQAVVTAQSAEIRLLEDLLRDRS